MARGVVPGTENGLDGAHHLLDGIGREIGADFLFISGFKLLGQLL